MEENMNITPVVNVLEDDLCNSFITNKNFPLKELQKRGISCIFIIGSSGSGKSTLSKNILTFYDKKQIVYHNDFDGKLEIAENFENGGIVIEKHSSISQYETSLKVLRNSNHKNNVVIIEYQSIVSVKLIMGLNPAFFIHKGSFHSISQIKNIYDTLFGFIKEFPKVEDFWKFLNTPIASYIDFFVILPNGIRGILWNRNKPQDISFSNIITDDIEITPIQEIIRSITDIENRLNEIKQQLIYYE